MQSSIRWILENFSLSMIILAMIFIVLHKAMRKNISDAEICYRWLALFGVGFTGFYGFIIHTFFPQLSLRWIGWVSSPFQFEVGIANLAFAVLGILSFNNNYGFRRATVIGVTFWLWGDAVGHIYNILLFKNFTVGNAGTWFVVDLMLPLMLLICLSRLRTGAPN